MQDLAVEKGHFAEKNLVKGDLVLPPRELRISSDRQSYDPARKLFIAEGRARALLSGSVLKADRIEFDGGLNNLYAVGKVRLKRGSQFFQASSLRYNLIKKEGKLKDVYGVVDIKSLIEESKKEIADIANKKTNKINSSSNSIEQNYKSIKVPRYFQPPINIRSYTLLDDQNITSLNLKDSFSVQASFGGTSSSSRDLDISSRLNRFGSRKFISGSINRWRLQADILTVKPSGWSSKRISFSNDPFTPTQTRIEADDVEAKEDSQGDILITSRRSRLIFEEKIKLPFITKKRIREKEEDSRLVFGIDTKDRDGLYIGLNMNPIELGDDYTLSLQPQFLMQRAINGGTNSYADSSKSVQSSREHSLAKTSDLIGLKARVNGKSFGWNVNANADMSSLNLERFAHGNRYWFELDKALEVPTFNEIEANIFGAYRYRAWNGSLGETDIYSAYGAFLEKKGNKKLGGSDFAYLLRLGAGNYQAESSTDDDLSGLWRGNIYGRVHNSFPILTWKRDEYFNPKNYRYSPSVITEELRLHTTLDTSYSAYQNGQAQNTIGLRVGPTLTLGNLRKRFFNYTKIAITAGAKLKQGSSPFEFDKAVDLGTLGLGLSQQIVGPLILKSEMEFNIDRGSEYFGKTINSKFELAWQRRSYDFGLYYNPYKGIGGFTVRLNDFDFNGKGVPFVPLKHDKLSSDSSSG